MPTTIVLERTTGDLVLAFDAVLNESHTSKSTVPRFPVEQGVSISDHIRREPDGITITGIVAESPIGPSFFALPEQADRLTAVVDLIESMREDLLRVVTSTKVYENMVIASVGRTIDQTTGRAVNATIELTQVRTVSTETIDLPAPRLQENKGTKKAPQRAGVDADQPPIATDDVSVARQAATALAKMAKADSAFAILTGAQ